MAVARLYAFPVGVQLCTKLWTPLVTTVCYSRYDVRYLEPTFRPEELEQPVEDNDPRKFQPIKAAKKEETSSIIFDPLVAKFTRMLIVDGYKDAARMCLDRTFEEVKLIQLAKYHRAATDEERNEITIDPLKIFYQAVENCQPVLGTQRAKRGGITYIVPIPCRPKYQVFQAMKWLIDSSNDKDSRLRFWVVLARELLDAARNEGKSVRKKHELHKLCEANRAYSHYRW